MAKPVWFFTDFDGTITLDDNQVKLLNAFAPQGWREKEYAILDAGGKSRQYLPVVYGDFQAKSTEEVLQYLRQNVQPDPFFPEFVRYCQDTRVPLEIISDGMHVYIEDYLNRTGLRGLNYYSNLVSIGPLGVEFSHPHVNLECGKCGTCKKKIVSAQKEQGYFIVYAGDGISDECAAAEADLLYAKGKLARYCASEKIPFVQYETFAEILEHFRHALSARGEY